MTGDTARREIAKYKMTLAEAIVCELAIAHDVDVVCMGHGGIYFWVPLPLAIVNDAFEEIGRPAKRAIAIGLDGRHIVWVLCI